MLKRVFKNRNTPENGRIAALWGLVYEIVLTPHEDADGLATLSIVPLEYMCKPVKQEKFECVIYDPE